MLTKTNRPESEKNLVSGRKDVFKTRKVNVQHALIIINDK